MFIKGYIKEVNESDFEAQKIYFRSELDLSSVVDHSNLQVESLIYLLIVFPILAGIILDIIILFS